MKRFMIADSDFVFKCGKIAQHANPAPRSNDFNLSVMFFEAYSFVVNIDLRMMPRC